MEHVSSLESVEVTCFGDIYRGRRVLVTGHTGFKGAWLALWLRELGAVVTGVALPPDTEPNHWSLLDLDIADHRVDLRDRDRLQQVFAEARPEIVFHMAAQALVRRSYRDPLETWSTNVMGTANVLECCRLTDGVRAIVVVTTDKCYENQEWFWGYRENDRLGGHDPYSASKAATELVAASYRSAFFYESDAPLLATVRAGNVIGGGDWSEDRLIPDLVRAVSATSPLIIRSPMATRPWQHVLEPLSGYLLVGQQLFNGQSDIAGPWNFGPAPEGNRSVAEVLQRLSSNWPELTWKLSGDAQPHEANLLYLDSAKARAKLGWRPVWSFDEALAATVAWYRGYMEYGHVASHDQLRQYCDSAQAARLQWVAA